VLVNCKKPCFIVNMSEQNETGLPAAIPAATMVIMHQDPAGGPPFLLMVERVKAMAFAGGAAVFPGGRIDTADFDYARELIAAGLVELVEEEAAARLAAIRETLEEAGLALGLLGVVDPADCADARAALHDGKTISDICKTYDWLPDMNALIPWARWRPPGMESRIFDTRFYLVDAGPVQLKAQVDNTENTSLFWETASGVLERAARREVKIIFPTRRNLERLALFNSFDHAVAHAADFPVKLITTYIEKRGDDQYICLPDGHGYPVLEESLASAQRG
jgi:8-oxo-dGTP pyrophosphatase MutT (NUDIX family)